MRAISRWASAARNRPEAGFSLPELIVAMALFGVLMTMVVTLFTSFTSTFTRERQAMESTNVAAIGMNEVTKVIRSGTTLTKPDRAVFVKADSEEIILYSYLADSATSTPKPIMVRLGIDGQRQLVESRWNATLTSGSWTFPPLLASPLPTHIGATPASSRVVARKIIPPTAAELGAGQLYLFTYLRLDGTVIDAPVTAAEIGNISTVKVTMTVQADETSRAAPVTIQNRVGLPNLTASRLGISG